MKQKRSYKIDRALILQLLRSGILTIGVGFDNTIKIFMRGNELTQRINNRQRSERGDPRVDVCYDSKKISIHISHLVWMFYTDCVLPEDFEIHHLDENPLNNIYHNIIAVHKKDHLKIHLIEESLEDAPF
jgi:hypothetical protein